MRQSAIVIVCTLTVGLAVAMPSDSDLVKSESGVAAIVSDVEKRERGDNDKVAESLLSLEGEAECAAEKFLFRREAVLRFLRAGKCDKAMDVLQRFVEEDDGSSDLV